VLIDIVQGAWQDYLAEKQFRFHRSTRAMVVWDYMVKRSDSELCGADGVIRIERHERPLYVLRDLFMLRPKMHDRESLTRNYPTKAQRGVVASGLFPGEAVPNVAFGYKLDAAEAGIEQCCITSPSDSWVLDLDDLAAGNLAPSKPMLAMPDYDRPWNEVAPIRFTQIT
jgi:hypothetical protein